MTGPRVWLPLEPIQCPAFYNCGYSARALLLELASQLRAKHGNIYNNGDLTTAFSVLRLRGWNDQKTIRAAANELVEAGLIVKTRQGRKPNVCTLYALTWLPLNESTELEISAKGFPLHAYRLVNPPLPTNATAQADGEKIPITPSNKGIFSPSELRPP